MSVTHITQLRHGESDGNIASLDGYFGGGHPDDIEGRDPIPLTHTGKLQAEAAGTIRRALQETGEMGAIGGIVSSAMKRAVQTADGFLRTYGEEDTVRYPHLTQTHEVVHGRLERLHPYLAKTKTEPLLTLCREAFRKVLEDNHLPKDLYEHAAWLQPRGDGTGETYLEAGLRTTESVDTFLTAHAKDDTLQPPNHLLQVGHNGAMRQQRALCVTYDADERKKLQEEVTRTIDEPLTVVRQDIQKTYEHGGDPPDLEEMTRLLRPLGTAAVELLQNLAETGLPKVSGSDGINAPHKRLGNGGLVIATITSQGKWRIQERITPTAWGEDVTYRREAYESPAVWV